MDLARVMLSGLDDTFKIQAGRDTLLWEGGAWLGGGASFFQCAVPSKQAGGSDKATCLQGDCALNTHRHT
jgi:hypothetical protein